MAKFLESRPVLLSIWRLLSVFLIGICLLGVIGSAGGLELLIFQLLKGWKEPTNLFWILAVIGFGIIAYISCRLAVKIYRFLKMRIIDLDRFAILIGSLLAAWVGASILVQR